MATHPIQPGAPVTPGATVSLMLTCLCDAFYPDPARATVEVLERLAFRVAFDPRQTCCGQPPFNAGDRDAARAIIAHAIDVFRDAPLIVCPSGSCAAMVRWGWLQALGPGDPLREEAVAIAGRTYEVHEFLAAARGDAPWPGRLDRTVVLHTSCHARVLGSGAAARQLLESVSGLNVVEPAEAEQCCGFGGAFATSFPWISSGIGARKLQRLRQSRAAEAATTDMGCAMHLDGLAKHEGNGAPPFRHVVEILREAMEAP